MASAMSSATSTFQRSARLNLGLPRPCAARAVARRQVKTQALANTIVVISGATAASLALGRFVLLPVQRGFAEKAGPPKQNGIPYPEAGDAFATPASFLLTSNDPAGFNVIDVLAWGALGHALGYFILATNSLQVNHVPTF